MLARDGPQIGTFEAALEKRTPRFISRSIFGVFACGWPPIPSTESFRSSQIIVMIFKLPNFFCRTTGKGRTIESCFGSESAGTAAVDAAAGPTPVTENTRTPKLTPLFAGPSAGPSANNVKPANPISENRGTAGAPIVDTPAVLDSGSYLNHCALSA